MIAGAGFILLYIRILCFRQIHRYPQQLVPEDKREKYRKAIIPDN